MAWCTDCGTQFVRPTDQPWRVRCRSCWLEQHIATRSARAVSSGRPLQSKPVKVTGPNYKPTCGCETPPWEICACSFDASGATAATDQPSSQGRQRDCKEETRLEAPASGRRAVAPQHSASGLK